MFSLLKTLHVNEAGVNVCVAYRSETWGVAPLDKSRQERSMLLRRASMVARDLNYLVEALDTLDLAKTSKSVGIKHREHQEFSQL